MKSEFRAIAAFVLLITSAALGIGLAAMGGTCWGTFVACAGFCGGALLLVAL